jgi:predicted amidohydrolase YtcJ
LAVLSQDICQADPLVIGKTRVMMTMVGGKIVFRAQQ